MKILRRILKILGIIIGSIVVLLLIATIITQTGFFKDRLRAMIASAISTNINGTLHLGKIEGNFLTGFRIDSLAIYDDEGPILRAGKINCAYDILPLVRNKLLMTSIKIEQPRIRIIRSTDGKWNIEKLVKKSTDTTAPSAEWELNFKSIKITGGMFYLYDSLALSYPSHWNLPSPFFEYHNFSVNDIDIDLYARINKNDIRIGINDFSCYSPESEFHLKKLKGAFSVVTDHVEAKDLIIQTGKSYLKINAYLGDINAFKKINLIDLEHDSLYLNIHSSTVNLTELRNFIPQVRFLNGSAYINLEAAGEFGNFVIKQLDLKTYESELRLTGNIRNLHRPEMLTLDIDINNGRINPGDASRLLPPFGIPSFNLAKSFSIKGHYSGYPIDFITNILLKGEDGEIDFAGQMNLKSSRPNYAFKFSAKNLDFHWLINDKDFHTRLFSTGEIAGEGFSINDITTNINISLDSTYIKDNLIDKAILNITAEPNYVHGKLAISSGKANIKLDAHTDFTNKEIPVYTGNLELSSFDLSRIINDSRYHSDLNVHGSFGGSGKSFKNLNAVLSLNLLPSQFHGHDLKSDTLNLILTQRDPENKSLSIRSPILDADFTGLYDLENDIPLLIDRTEGLIHVIARHTYQNNGLKDHGKQIYTKKPKNRMNFDYYLNIKDLEPISSLLENIPFNARTEISGAVIGNENLLSLSSTGTINEFFVGTTRGGVLLQNGTVDISIDSLSPVQTLDHFSGKIELRADSGLINTKKIENIRALITYNSSRSKSEFSLTYDSLYKCYALGTISVQPATYVFDFDSLIVMVGTSRWQNLQDVQLRLNNDGFQIMHAAFVRKDEQISLSGIFKSTGDLNLRTNVRNFDLSAFNIFIHDNGENKPGLEGKLDIDLSISGTDSLPEISLNAICKNTSYRKSRIGTITTEANYRDSRATFLISAYENGSDSPQNFTLRGFIPINLGKTSNGERFPDSEQLVELISDGFNLAAIDPLLKDFENLTGKLTCNLMVRGTPRNPDLSGKMKFEDVKFLFLPNSINYILNAELEPSRDKIILNSCTITNQKYKRISGTSTYTGYILIHDYKVTSFDIIARGQILLMTDATKRSMPEMYGTLFGETGPDGLSIAGTPSKPVLSGTLFVREANLIFPPTKTSEIKSASNFTLQKIVIDDTSKEPRAKEKISKFFSTDDMLESEWKGDIESPLIDRLRYNLTIETRGPTALRMIFTPTTGEELYAELEGNVNAINEEGKPTIYGTIEVTSRSYYNFFKRFDAKGKLKFSGQWNNPELDIEASYEGYKQVVEQKTSQIVATETQSLPSSQSFKEQKVIVQLKITGTRYEPKLNLGMKVQLKPGEEPVDWSTQAKGGDIQSDAISFIITGKFRDELTSREQQEFTDIGSSTGTSLASSLVSSIFSDVLKKEFPFILHADLSYRGGSIQEGTSVNVTATVLTGYLRAGGKILSDIGNMNLSYQLNIGDVFKSPSIRNLYLEIQRKVEGDTPEDKKLTNEARLFYKFSF